MPTFLRSLQAYSLHQPSHRHLYYKFSISSWLSLLITDWLPISKVRSELVTLLTQSVKALSFNFSKSKFLITKNYSMLIHRNDFLCNIFLLVKLLFWHCTYYIFSLSSISKLWILNLLDFTTIYRILSLFFLTNRLFVTSSKNFALKINFPYIQYTYTISSLPDETLAS